MGGSAPTFGFVGRSLRFPGRRNSVLAVAKSRSKVVITVQCSERASPAAERLARKGLDISVGVEVLGGAVAHRAPRIPEHLVQRVDGGGDAATISGVLIRITLQSTTRDLGVG